MNGAPGLIGILLCGLAGAASAIAAEVIPATLPVKPTTATEQCANQTCHTNLLSFKVMHGPTAQKKCGACHEYDEPREHRFRPIAADNQHCDDCHTIKHRTFAHAPVKQGRCTSCHNPHGSDHRAMLISEPTQGLCLTCHKQDAMAHKKFVHGPAATGACILCHEPHSGWQPKLLVETPDKLCIGCHAEISPKGDDARHVHAALKDGCTGCHDAHASDEKFQLRQAAPALCLSCHKEMAQQLASSAVVHGAVNQSDGCYSCHSPHFSQLPKLQKVSQPQSCLTNCHDHTMQAADGHTIVNMAELLRDNPEQHGPIREGACTACHQPHAASRPKLLAADYPPEFYAPFKIERYSLCFKCHMPDLVLNKKGVGVTRFRNGETNLHWLHVNQEKGRTCRACHEVHASKHAFHIRDAVPFGTKGWLLEIRFAATPTGGTCSPGCHQARSYDHGNGKPANTAQLERKGDVSASR